MEDVAAVAPRDAEAWVVVVACGKRGQCREMDVDSDSLDK